MCGGEYKKYGLRLHIGLPADHREEHPLVPQHVELILFQPAQKQHFWAPYMPPKYY